MVTVKKTSKKPQPTTNHQPSKLMNVVDMPIGEIKRYHNNPRINEHAIPSVRASLDAYDWQQPIVCDVNHVIIVGDTRYQAALLRGDEMVPVQIAKNLTPAQVAAYRLADNKVGEQSMWDMSKLYAEVQALENAPPEEIGDLKAMGFSDEDLGIFAMENRVDDRMLQDFNVMPIAKPKWILIAAPEDECALILSEITKMQSTKKLKNTLTEYSAEPRGSRYGNK